MIWLMSVHLLWEPSPQRNCKFTDNTATVPRIHPSLTYTRTRKAWRPAPVAAPNPPPNLEEEDSETSEESDEEEGKVSSLSVRERRHPIARMLTQQSIKELPTTKEVYGFELQEPLPRDMYLYQR